MCEKRSVTDVLRIVVGNEPRFYRETLAAVFRLLRPHLEVMLVEPDDLEGEVGRRAHVVVCSRLSQTIQTRALAWILLYPEAENRAEVGFAGRQRSIAGAEITDLLAVIDEAEWLARGGAAARRGSA